MSNPQSLNENKITQYTIRLNKIIEGDSKNIVSRLLDRVPSPPPKPVVVVEKPIQTTDVFAKQNEVVAKQNEVVEEQNEVVAEQQQKSQVVEPNVVPQTTASNQPITIINQNPCPCPEPDSSDKLAKSLDNIADAIRSLTTAGALQHPVRYDNQPKSNDSIAAASAAAVAISDSSKDGTNQIKYRPSVIESSVNNNRESNTLINTEKKEMKSGPKNDQTPESIAATIATATASTSSNTTATGSNKDIGKNLNNLQNPTALKPPATDLIVNQKNDQTPEAIAAAIAASTASNTTTNNMNNVDQPLTNTEKEPNNDQTPKSTAAAIAASTALNAPTNNMIIKP